MDNKAQTFAKRLIAILSSEKLRRKRTQKIIISIAVILFITVLVKYSL